MVRRIVYFVDQGDKSGLIAALESDPLNIAFTDVGGQSLLHAAARKGIPTEIAEELISRDIDVNRQDARGSTALQYATFNKRKDLVEMLLKAGARPDIADVHGNQPLWYAVGDPHRDHELIELLMRWSSDPHHPNKNGKTPLEIARHRGYHKALRILEETKPQLP